MKPRREVSAWLKRITGARVSYEGFLAVISSLVLTGVFVTEVIGA